MKRSALPLVLVALLTVSLAQSSFAQTFPVLAIGDLNQTRAGSFADLSGLTYNLENSVPANYLGGMGSAITWASGNIFLAVPDRGPNAVLFNSAMDDTVSFINRFHTIEMHLVPNRTNTGLPFTLEPKLLDTTLLWNPTALIYGTGNGLAISSGVPPLNDASHFYFTGRSDNFDPSKNSGNSADGRFDSEGIRVSNDGASVFMSDEYGPYVYEFDRQSGRRLRSFALPESFYVPNLSPVGNTEISSNTVGRTANKGMEGLAITPDGTTLVGIVQAPLIQDQNLTGASKKLLHILTIDIASGEVTHQFAYLLTTGSGVSEILALNNHEFLVDERDGKGRGDGSNAAIKQLFKIDLNGAVDISGLNGTVAATHAVGKTLFLDVVQSLVNAGFTTSQIPAKIEGISFGRDVEQNGTRLHTIWIANDNDFLATVKDPNGNTIPNANQFFVLGFTDADLKGSEFVPQFAGNSE